MVNCVRNQDQEEPINYSEGLPPMFTIFNAVLYRHVKWVGKDAYGKIETYAMLLFVGGFFGAIPFKLNVHIVLY